MMKSIKRLDIFVGTSERVAGLYSSSFQATTLNIAQSTQVIYAVWDSEGSTDTHSGKVNPGSSDCLTGDSPTTVSQTPWEQITSKPTT